MPSDGKKLAARAEKVWGQYQRAIQRGKFDGSATDRQVYDYCLIHERAGADLPRFDTWQRYLRKARRHYDAQKNRPRVEREHGSSVIREEQIEPDRQNE